MANEKRDSVISYPEKPDADHRDEDGHLVMPPQLAALSEEEYTKLGKRATLKMDIVIMPCMTITYVLNYLDRQNIASAKLAHIEEDLSMDDVQYQTSVSILFVGYILMQVPSNMIAGKVKWPAIYICCAMALWGALSALMASVQNFGGLVACRFFIGFVEAAFFPGALYFLSLFYNRQQFALRTAILYSGSQLGNAFGGLFAIAILKLDNVYGIEGWRWLFIVEGVITVGLATVFAFILPNSHKKIMGMNELETDWVQWNMESDLGQRDISEEITAWHGFVLAVRDPKTWLFTGILYSTYIVGTVSNFFPTVVGGLGYSRTLTYVLTAPPFLLCVVCMLINGFHSDKTQERFYHVVGPLVITLVANILAVATTEIAPRYVAMMLLPASFYSSAIVILSWITGSLNQPAAKRASVIAFINTLCNTPNIWGSYMYYSAPRYVTAFAVNVVASALAITFAVVARIYLGRLNAKLDEGQSPGKNGPTAAQIASGFRYLL